MDFTTQNQIYNFSFYNYLKDFYYIVWGWAYFLVFFTLVHLFLPLGNPHFIPFSIASWIHFGMIPILLAPFTGWLLFAHIQNGLQISPTTTTISNDITPFISTRYYFREKANDGLYQKSVYLFIVDLLTVTSFIRGFHSLMNWLYQVTYLGVRLWLVFILHSFCLGCLQELVTVFLDQHMSFTFMWGGLLSLGVSLSLFMVGYVMIQIYVYISFSLSFVFSTVFSWYRTDQMISWKRLIGESGSTIEHQKDPILEDVSGGIEVVDGSTAPSHRYYIEWKSIQYLVPVSLVEISPTHIYIMVMSVALLLLIYSTVWMSEMNGMESSFHKKINNQVKWERIGAMVYHVKP